MRLLQVQVAHQSHMQPARSLQSLAHLQQQQQQQQGPSLEQEQQRQLVHLQGICQHRRSWLPRAWTCRGQAHWPAMLLHQQLLSAGAILLM
jgi:hypothetical protein